MTDGNPRPDEEPIPPTSTEWSEARDSDDDDELAPPFTPGAPGAGAANTPPPAEPDLEPPAQARPAARPGDDDDFPAHAFDIEGGEVAREEPVGTELADAASAEPEPPGWEARQPETTVPAAESIARTRAAADLADRLESMARRLRERGPEAAESEMRSPDRFTALLAGLLAGYLTDRE